MLYFSHRVDKSSKGADQLYLSINQQIHKDTEERNEGKMKSSPNFLIKTLIVYLK